MEAQDLPLAGVRPATRLHREVQPKDFDPDARMLALLDLCAPPPPGEAGAGAV